MMVEFIEEALNKSILDFQEHGASMHRGKRCLPQGFQ
jgi:hypothetical protein